MRPTIRANQPALCNLSLPILLPTRAPAEEAEVPPARNPFSFMLPKRLLSKLDEKHERPHTQIEAA